MENILNSIKAYLYERHASPLFGAFIFSWLVWNYKLLVILFSELKPVEMFSEIDKLFSSVHIYSLKTDAGLFSVDIWGGLLNGLLIPAGFTVFYIYIYPRLAEPVYQYSLQKQIKLRAIKQKEEKQKLLSREESDTLHLRLSQLQIKYSEESEAYQNQIKSLTEQIESLQVSDANEELAPEKIDSDSTTQNLTNQEALSGDKQKVIEEPYDVFKKKFLKAFAGSSHEKGLSLDNVLNGLDPEMHIDKKRYYRDEILQEQLVSFTGNHDQNSRELLYTLTKKGRKYLVDNDLLDD